MTEKKHSNEKILIGESESKYVPFFYGYAALTIVSFLIVSAGIVHYFFDDKPTEITRTIIANNNLASNDSTHAVDLTGNGLFDYVVANETGELYWYEQIAIGTFATHTINESSVSRAKVEGVLFIDIDGNGNFELLVMDQENNEIRIYAPDTADNYRGTWSGSTILTSREQIQRPVALDIDEDGVDELVYAWEGNGTSTGGLHWLDYDGDSITSSGSYTDYTMVAEPGAWWIGDERRDISGNGKSTDIVFSSRIASNNTTPGIFVALEPNHVTDTWTIKQIENEEKDWLHVYFGNFFGTTDRDIIAHAFDGTIALYDYENNWARTTIAADINEAGYNAFPHYLYRNGRQKFITTGHASGILSKVRMVEWYWDGFAWTQRLNTAGINQKTDNFFRWDDMDGSGQLELIGSDSNADNFAYYTFPYDSEAYTVNYRDYIK